MLNHQILLSLSQKIKIARFIVIRLPMQSGFYYFSKFFQFDKLEFDGELHISLQF